MAHIDKIIRKLFSEIAEKHNYKNFTLQLKAMSSGGTNFSSELYTATVSSPDQEDLHMFVKVAVLSDSIRAFASAGVDFFGTEYFVYSDLAEKFRRIEEKCGVPEEDRFTFCKYYCYHPNIYEETLVLENLAAKGFIVYDRMKSVDWPYASKAVETLAKFHALSMAYGEQYPEVCQELSEKFDKFAAGFDAMTPTIKKFIAMAIKETRPENKERLAFFFYNEMNCDMLHYTKPRRKPVLIHGEYRQTNLMHRMNEDGTMDLIPLDFQTIRPGCIVSDLLYFIFGSSDKEFRDQYYKQLMEHYYQQLSDSLRALHFDPEKVYSKDDFQAELKEILPYGLVCGVMFLPIITAEPENAPGVHDGDLFENMANTKTSSVYPQRLNGVVDDYVRWGII